MRMKRCFTVMVVLALLGIMVTGPATAQPGHLTVQPLPANIIVPSSRAHGLSIAREKAIKITGVDVLIDILESTATTTIEVRLENQTNRRQEAEVILPVPAGAVVKGFAYDGPHGLITAQVLAQDEARRIYERLVAKLRDPALVEFIGLNLIRSNVFPVEAHGKQKIRLTYEHLLEINDNRIDYVLPRTESLQYQVPWSITATIKAKHAIATVYCPSHKVYTNRASVREVSVKIDAAAQKQPGAFRLSYLLEKQGVTASLFAYPDKRVGGGYFLLLAGLPSRPSEPENTLKREVTLVLDRSGSMRGEKIKQAREAARQIIAGLRPGEAFNIMVYSNTVESFAPGPVIKDEQTEARAHRYIEGITATGGTNIYDALNTALGQAPAEGMLPMVLFLTDGLPTVGQTAETAIRSLVTQANPHKRRVFTFGVGFDVNAPLLDRLAEASKARAAYVLPHEDVEVRVGKVFASLAGPVLADTKLRVLEKDGTLALGRTRDILPALLPDLFAADQLILLGQYVGDEPLRFEVSGNFQGKTTRFTYDFDLGKASQCNGFVPRLWASRKIAELIDIIRQMGADPAASSSDPKVKELTDEIVRLSTEFGILTEYTAFLAREGTVLHDHPEVLRETTRRLSNRAMRERVGRPGLNQSKNMIQQKAQTRLNYHNSYLNQQLERVSIDTVQQINDLAFYNKGNRWVDSRLARRTQAPQPDRVVQFGSDAYFDLARKLARQGRQASIAFDMDVLLWVEGETVLVEMGNR